MERAKPSSMQSPGRGECSKFVETSLGASHDMRFPAVDASTLRKEANQTAKQYDSDDFSLGNDHANRENDTPDDIASEKPEVEAYWKGSWWDVEILQMDLAKCYVHYKNFHYNDDQWVPMNHLRMRSRASEFSDCRRIVPRIDVCVMVRHPHSDTESPAWYDARIIDLERKPHPPEICKCWFWIALYTIPEILQSDISQRECLPVKSDAVALTEMSIMTEARNMSFHEILAASLPSVTNSPRIWAKDGSHWYSSVNHISRSEEKNFYFENRGAGDSLGLPISQGHREKSVSPQLLPFDAFVEEEGLLLEQTSESPDVNIDEDDDIIVISSDSEEQPTVLDVDVESDASCEITQMNDRGIMYLDRYASDDSNVWEINPERVEDFRDNPNSTSNLESLGNSDEDQAEMIVSDLHSLKLAERSPSKTTFVTPDKSSPSPCDQIVPLVQGTVQPSEPAASSEDSEADFAKHPEQYIGFPEIVSTDEPAKSFENPDADEFADYTERNIVRNVSDQQPVPENYTAAAKRKVAEEHVTKGKTAVNPSVKRRRLNSDVKFSFQGICNKGGLKTKPSHLPVQQHIERLSSKNTAKEKSTIYPSKNVETLGATLASFPVTGGRILDEIASTGLEEYADELEGLLLDASLDMTEPKLVAYSKEALKTGCAPQVVKEKRSKKNAREIAAVRRRPVEKEITYSDLFDCVKLVQPNIPSQEKGPSEDFTWVPQFSPLFKYAGAVPQEVKVDPLADVWEAMRVAEESVKKVNEWTKEAVHEGTNFVGICEHPDGSVHSEHGTLKFDQEVGEVCEVCGIIVTNIKDMWARDNAKRIAGKQEGNDGRDVDMYGFDEDMDTLASWNPDDENHKQQKNIERDSNFELIPDLAKHMQRHQKQGFQFLWRNLDGQGSNGNHCFEKGGCVLSHAPGTGKTFLILSFLHSYLKKYPETRPIILAPKIMLQPWMKEFTKWNVDIPVYNFNQSDEQGRALLQQHEDTGRILLNRIGRSQRKKRLLVYREAMIWQWINTQSVLVMSYPMFNNLYKISPSDTRMFRLRTLLLERPTIMILDEGHVIRINNPKF